MSIVLTKNVKANKSVTSGAGNIHLVRNPNYVPNMKERERVCEDRTRWLPKSYMSCFERTVTGAGKHTYTMLYMTNCVCLLLGEKFIF